MCDWSQKPGEITQSQGWGWYRTSSSHSIFLLDINIGGGIMSHWADPWYPEYHAFDILNTMHYDQHQDNETQPGTSHSSDLSVSCVLCAEQRGTQHAVSALPATQETLAALVRRNMCVGVNQICRDLAQLCPPLRQHSRWRITAGLRSPWWFPSTSGWVYNLFLDDFGW